MAWVMIDGKPVRASTRSIPSFPIWYTPEEASRCTSFTESNRSQTTVQTGLETLVEEEDENLYDVDRPPKPSRITRPLRVHRGHEHAAKGKGVRRRRALELTEFIKESPGAKPLPSLILEPPPTSLLPEGDTPKTLARLSDDLSEDVPSSPISLSGPPSTSTSSPSPSPSVISSVLSSGIASGRSSPILSPSPSGASSSTSLPSSEPEHEQECASPTSRCCTTPSLTSAPKAETESSLPDDHDTNQRFGGQVSQTDVEARADEKTEVRTESTTSAAGRLSLPPPVFLALPNSSSSRYRTTSITPIELHVSPSPSRKALYIPQPGTEPEPEPHLPTQLAPHPSPSPAPSVSPEPNPSSPTKDHLANTTPTSIPALTTSSKAYLDTILPLHARFFISFFSREREEKRVS